MVKCIGKGCGGSGFIDERLVTLRNPDSPGVGLHGRAAWGYIKFCGSSLMHWMIHDLRAPVCGGSLRWRGACLSSG
jgi:hypothetical protein